MRSMIATFFLSIGCLGFACDDAELGSGFEITEEENQIQKFVKKHANGQVAIMGYLRNDIAFGTWIEWYASGEKKAEYSFVDGKEDGTRTTWYEGGVIAEQGPMKFGLQNGPWKMWYENGKVKAETTYLKGVENGERIHWFANGNRKSKATIVDGYQNGLRTFWYENGKVQARGYFKGHCWDKNMCDEYKQGAEETFSEEGLWVSTICYSNGKPVRDWLSSKQQPQPNFESVDCGG